MHRNTHNKRKIINDPVHGFITIPDELIFDLIEHPYFQRLRRIKQLGLSHLVYPGANHTRFHHALGAMHLMTQAIAVLRSKDVEITAEEQLGVTIAILLHDIGHGPFSHTLEHSLLKSVHHEDISILFMERLNEEFDNRLDLALQIFKDEHPKKFLHQLVSSQLDMDRLDYLQRDSYFTGVSEGVVGSDRIITMLNVANNQLVIEAKGIYSIENFIGARRIMYWQVYMHKTVVSSELMLISILRRAKYLYKNGHDLFASPSLKVFLKNDVQLEEFRNNREMLMHFALIDDSDISTSIKVWQSSEDKVLSILCKSISSRQLFKTKIAKDPFSSIEIKELQLRIINKFGLAENEVDYFITSEKLTNNAYDETQQQINILNKSGIILDIAQASDNLNIMALSKPVEKYYLCHANVD
ncbi:HD domain-containing protein [Crocinitomix catalasitica]|uniref:HD domain-containing protein n=1 Tax=Crocinitomix catalasitica TaxID=184607 RepID=UPI000485F6B4|nr:HD domain-containing protein [Crocinitomix catalasitica]